MFRYSVFPLLAASAAVISVTACATTVHAQTSLPPNTPLGVLVPTIPTGVPPFKGTLIFELKSPLFATNGAQNNATIIDGSVISSVFRNSNNTLDFLYQFQFSSLSNATIGSVSIASFKNVADVSVAQTAEDVDGSNGLPAQANGGVNQNFFTDASSNGSFVSASRPGIDGIGINAGLTTGVTKNQNTYTLIVRTSATDYSLFGSSSVQGDGISAFTTTPGAIAPFAATEAPEPGSIALLATGLLPMAGGLALRRRRRRA